MSSIRRWEMRSFSKLKAAAAAATAVLFCSNVPTAHAQVAATWTTGTGNWSTENATSSGWSGTKPDGIGDTGTFDITGKSSATTVQDLTGSRTVGRLEITGGTTENASWQITLAAGKNLIMDQTGAGPAVLACTTTSSAANPALIINSSAGQIILNDDLL